MSAYRPFLEANRLAGTISAALEELATGKAPLAEVGQNIRRAILRGEWPSATARAITAAYRELCLKVALSVGVQRIICC